jgi:hypothetical protein
MIRRVVISSVTIAGKMRVFYEQGHWCQGLFFAFSFIGFLHFLLFVVLLCRMLLSTGFLYAFLMSCVGAARCRLGFERRVDAAISRSASGTKTRAQSSEHGVVATGEHDHLLGSLCVEGDIRLLRDPDAMEQDCQFACHSDHGLIPRLLAAS